MCSPSSTCSSRFGSTLRVVPLFEEVATLERAGDTVRALLRVRRGLKPASARPRRMQRRTQYAGREREGAA